MKYIIDMPENPAFVNAFYYTDGTPIATNVTEFKPYTEPDRKAIEDEVWELVRIITDMTEKQREECFGKSTCDLDEYLTYQEAKARYEQWKKEKDEIRVGDEVVYSSNLYNYDTKGVVLNPETDDMYAVLLTLDNFNRITASHNELKKTGRRFDEVEELLKKMREG